MANVELTFLDQIDNHEKTLKVFFNEKDNTGYKNHSIRIWVDNKNKNINCFFDFDEATAIRFSKALRTEISKLKEYK